MKLFGNLFRSRDKPKNSLLGNAYSFFFGGTSSGKYVNERSAMQTAAVYACVRILLETIAGLPLGIYEYTKVGKEKAMDHSFYYLLHNEPNPEFQRVRRDHVPYDVWEKQGFIRTTEGNVVHYVFIENFIDELGKKYHIKEIAFDRWGAVQMVQNLEELGFTIVPFGQGFKDMSQLRR